MAKQAEERKDLMPPETWLRSRKSPTKELVFYGAIYLGWLFFNLIIYWGYHAWSWSIFWLISILPLVVVSINLFHRIKRIELTLYKFEYKFHLGAKPKADEEFNSEDGEIISRLIAETFYQQKNWTKFQRTVQTNNNWPLDDKLFIKALKTVERAEKAGRRVHPRLFQEKLRVGYGKASEIINQMVSFGVLADTKSLTEPKEINKFRLQELTEFYSYGNESWFSKLLAWFSRLLDRFADLLPD